MSTTTIELYQGTKPTLDGVVVGVYGKVGNPATGIRLWITEPGQQMRDVTSDFGEPIRLNEDTEIIVDGIAQEAQGSRGTVFKAHFVSASDAQRHEDKDREIARGTEALQTSDEESH